VFFNQKKSSTDWMKIEVPVGWLVKGELNPGYWTLSDAEADLIRGLKVRFMDWIPGATLSGGLAIAYASGR